MKTMCPLGYPHNGLVATHALKRVILQLTEIVTIKETTTATTAIPQMTKIVQ